MSGKGTEVRRKFEELRQIIDRVELKDKLGVCLDTCHVWDGGYDIVNDLDSVFEEFDRIIGLDRLKAIHLNDSLNPFGAHKDRHARIGEGQIGKAALIRVVCHPLLKHLPFYLETPNELDGYAAEIQLMRQASVAMRYYKSCDAQEKEIISTWTQHVKAVLTDTIGQSEADYAADYQALYGNGDVSNYNMFREKAQKYEK